MGLFDFVKDAGSKIFGIGDDEPQSPTREVRTVEMAQADRAKSGTLTKLIVDMGFEGDDVDVKFFDGKATMTGKVGSQADREKMILLVGNTQGVAQVDDLLTVEKPEPEATLYTVKSGDSLSKIAKEHYGDAMKYTVIFEANKPMLTDPNKIYPGQALRIPPLSE